MIDPGPLFLLQPNFPAFTHRRRMALQPRDPDFAVLEPLLPGQIAEIPPTGFFCRKLW